jgi:hypothetical protein
VTADQEMTILSIRAETDASGQEHPESRYRLGHGRFQSQPDREFRPASHAYFSSFNALGRYRRSAFPKRLPTRRKSGVVVLRGCRIAGIGGSVRRKSFGE